MKSLSYLNKYLIKYKWHLILGVIFIAISNYFGVEMPKVVKNAVNDFLQHSENKTKIGSIWSMVFKLGGLYMLLNIGKGLFLFLQRQSIIVMSRNIEYDLKNEIYSQYQKLGFNFYKKNKTGDLMNRITEDVAQIRSYLGPGLMYTINLVVLFTFIVTTMLQISVSLTLIVLAPLPIMTILIFQVSKKMNFLSTEVQKEQSVMSSIVQETFSGIRVIKAYLREKERKSVFNGSVDGYKDKTMDLVRVNAVFTPTITFLVGLSTLLSIYYGGLLVYSNDITPGDIVAFIMYVNMLTWPFASVGWVTAIVQRASASQARINEFLKTEAEIVSDKNNPIPSIEKISFENVQLVYENSGMEVLRDISFTIRKGQSVGIIGKTGSGKTSILNLIARQIDANSGVIKVNDLPIKDLDLSQYRSHLGIVPQEVFLFSDSIRNNIQFANNDRILSEEELKYYTEKSHVYHNIIQFKEGFDTVLGERGVNLSGGQKQRISIARALAKEPQLILLDDCLSAVDTETEEIILKSLCENMDEKISVIVSHRVSSLRYVDYILVIDDGRIIDQGSHEELSQRSGIFKEMQEQQLKKQN